MNVVKAFDYYFYAVQSLLLSALYKYVDKVNCNEFIANILYWKLFTQEMLINSDYLFIVLLL